LEEIYCNIRFKQGCPLPPTLFGIYIDKLEACLEEAGYVGTTLVELVITFFFTLMISFLW